MSELNQKQEKSEEIQMTSFENVVKATALILIAVLIVTPLSRAQGKKQTTAQTSKPPVADQKVHRVVLQVASNNPQ